MSEKVLCHCSRKCGGPNGAGRLLTRRVVNRHQRQEREHEARLLLASTSSYNEQLLQISSVNPGRKRQAEYAPENQNKRVRSARDIQASKSHQNESSPLPVEHGNEQLEGSNLEGDSHTDELENRARTELQRHSTPEQSLQLQTSASMGTNELANECKLRDDEREVEEDEREIEDSGDLDVNGDAPPDLEREDSRDADIPDELRNAETSTPRFNPVLNDLKISQNFIELLQNASLESDIEPLPDDVIHL